MNNSSKMAAIAAGNFTPAVAMPNRCTIVEAQEIIEPGELDPAEADVPRGQRRYPRATRIISFTTGTRIWKVGRVRPSSLRRGRDSFGWDTETESVTCRPERLGGAWWRKLLIQAI
jgi:hypothetical protein